MRELTVSKHCVRDMFGGQESACRLVGLPARDLHMGKLGVNLVMYDSNMVELSDI